MPDAVAPALSHSIRFVTESAGRCGRARTCAAWLLGAGALVLGCAGPVDGSGTCQPGDADGIIGGQKTVGVTVDDEGFTPTPITAQNTATVTIELRNTGTAPHGFAVGCVATPNDTGCPTKSCFPEDARIAPVDPGSTGTARFVVPLTEAIYPVTSTAAGDAFEGQFVVQ